MMHKVKRNTLWVGIDLGRFQEEQQVRHYSNKITNHIKLLGLRVIKTQEKMMTFLEDF